MAKPRGLSKAVRLRREALSEVTRVVADGMFEAARSIILDAAAIAPDSPFDPYPLGEGLPKQGGVLAYVGGQKVNGWSIRGPQPAKPRAVRVLAKEHAVTVVAGFGFPGRLAETGSVDTPAQPFLTPTKDRHIAQIPADVARVSRPRLR